MNENNPNIKYAKALYDFRPQHTDELTFNKDDIICINQSLEGGWWEGSLNDCTGWFPSNFVTPLSISETNLFTSKLSENIIPKKEKENYFLVVESLTTSEQVFINEISELLQNYLLQIDKLFSAPEFSCIQSNLDEILDVHKYLLNALQEFNGLPISQQQIGSLFVQISPKIKGVHLKYCKNYPKANYILLTKRNEIIEYIEQSKGQFPNLKSLTTLFSLPLRRLEKYSNILSELDRHIEKLHSDRGGIQRAVVIYREISLECLEARKRKESELEILNSDIKGWDGEKSIGMLGEVIMMSYIQLRSENSETNSRIVILFPGIIIILSLTARTNEYNYEGQFPIYGCSLSILDDSNDLSNAIEITSCNGAQKLIFIFSTSAEKNNWLRVLRQPVKYGPANINSKPTPPGMIYPLPTPRHQNPPTPPQHHKLLPPRRTRSAMCNLRPYPPLRPTFGPPREGEGARSPKSAKKFSVVTRKKSERAMSQEEYLVYKKIDDIKVLEDDAILLNVIEAYCNSARIRHTVNSTILENPHMLIADEEKLILEETRGDQVIVEERTLVDTVYSLRDQICDLKMEVQQLSNEIGIERIARIKLENIVKMACKNGSDCMVINKLNTSLN